MTNRRFFIQRLSAVTATSMIMPVVLQSAPLSKENSIERPSIQFPIGFAGYSFVKFNLDKSLEMMKQLQVKYLSVKDFHLPLDSSPVQMDAIKKKFADNGITPYTVGVIYMKSKQEVDHAFAYAQEIVKRSPDAVRGAKELLNRLTLDFAAAQFAAERRIIGGLIGGHNQREAVMSDFEKRAPAYIDPA